ncbi:MAG: hypothetical protein HYW26_02185 [Candidatus Aenigmarchaeota archaeon]|nr:hypothetical protein [Candidatus Aenigmarchaeota archaeon]
MKEMSMEKAIVQVFMDSPTKIFAVQEIYSGFQKYYELRDFQKQKDSSGQLRFHNAVRSILARLEKSGKVTYLGDDMRKLGKK